MCPFVSYQNRTRSTTNHLYNKNRPNQQSAAAVRNVLIVYYYSSGLPFPFTDEYSNIMNMTMTMKMKTFINSSKHSNVNIDKNTVALN